MTIWGAGSGDPEIVVIDQRQRTIAQKDYDRGIADQSRVKSALSNRSAFDTR